MTDLTPPLSLSAASRLGEAALALAGVPTMKPLPPPRVAPRRAAAAASQTGPPGSLAELWDGLRAFDCSATAVGGVRATLGAVRGDVLRKQLDQRPRWAGRGPAPPGFTELDGIEVEAGRAPLHALFRAPEAGRPVIFVLHGLYDSKQSGYVRRTAEWLAGLGYGVVAPDLRWHGRLLDLEHLPTVGLLEAQDLAAWSRWLRARHPGHPHGLLAFSLGTLTAAHALGSPEAASRFASGGVLVSPPGPLAEALGLLDTVPLLARPTGRGLVPFLFRFVLRERLRRLGLGAARRLPFATFLEELSRRRPLGEALAPDEILARGDHLPALARAARPLLLLSADDDPIFPRPAPARLAEAAAGNDRVHVLRSPCGGHLGLLVTQGQWFSDVVARFFACSETVG